MIRNGRADRTPFCKINKIKVTSTDIRKEGGVYIFRSILDWNYDFFLDENLKED